MNSELKNYKENFRVSSHIQPLKAHVKELEAIAASETIIKSQTATGNCILKRKKWGLSEAVSELENSHR